MLHTFCHSKFLNCIKKKKRLSGLIVINRAVNAYQQKTGYPFVSYGCYGKCSVDYALSKLIVGSEDRFMMQLPICPNRITG
jgi:hypothetical protein